MKNPQTIESARDFLFARHAKGMKLGLVHMQELVRLLGHPEHGFPSVHIAGTNGKGSTSALLDAMLRTAGLRVGLYTSPHLSDERERIRVDGQKNRIPRFSGSCPGHAVPHRGHRRLLLRDPHGHGPLCTFLRAGWIWPCSRRAWAAALDATSVVTPTLSVITRIGKDHTRILGDRLEAIAAEKAGILKPGRPGLIGQSRPRVRPLLRRPRPRTGHPPDLCPGPRARHPAQVHRSGLHL